MALGWEWLCDDTYFKLIQKIASLQYISILDYIFGNSLMLVSFLALAVTQGIYS